jgi:hypothetical protein
MVLLVVGGRITRVGCVVPPYAGQQHHGGRFFTVDTVGFARSMGLVPPNGPPPIDAETNGHQIKVRRRGRLGGLLHEYERAA